MSKFCDCEKVAYASKSEAQEAARGIWDDDKIHMTPYKCPEGNGYHLATGKTGKTLRDIPHRLNDVVKIPLKKKSKNDKM